MESLNGWWWLPGHEDQAKFGQLTLARSPTGPWKLEVYGALERRTAPLTGFPEFTDEITSEPIIHGHLEPGASGPRFVTLIGCWQQAATSTLGGVANGERTESWMFDDVVAGHENVDENESIVSIRVRLSNLLAWYGWRGPVVEQSGETTTVSVTSIDVGAAEVPDASIALRLDHSTSASDAQVTLFHQAAFEVYPAQPVTSQLAISDYAMPLRSFLSFMTLAHVDVASLAVTLERHNQNSHRHWFDWRTRLQRPLEDKKPPRPHEMLATWRDLASMTVQGLVSGWFGLWREPDIQKAITYLLIPHHAPYLFADDHVMTAMVAVEAYHRDRFDDAAIAPDEFRNRLETVVAAAPDDLRVWTREKLSDRNTKGQKSRLKEVVDRSGATGEAILVICPKFVDVAIASRNMVAHPSRRSREPGAMYLAVSYGLRWILRHCLLVDLGLTEDRVAALIRENEVFRGECELIGRWTEN